MTTVAWFPITTLPVSDTPVLLFFDPFHYYDIGYHDGEEWLDYNHDSPYTPHHPTHWTHLPEAPTP